MVKTGTVRKEQTSDLGTSRDAREVVEAAEREAARMGNGRIAGLQI